MDTQEFPSIFRMAEEASKYSSHRQHRIGTVIMIKNRPVAIGFNHAKTHPSMGYLKKTHAELSAILSIKNKNRLKGATMVVFRRRKDGSLGNARPCEHCQKLLDQYGFSKFIYTTDGGWCEESRSKNKFNYNRIN